MNFLFAWSYSSSNLISLLAFAPPQQDGQPPNLLMSILPMLLLFAGLWFLMIAPQRKKQKQHEKLLSELQPGAQVVTTGGLHGTISSVKDDRFVLKIADNVKVQVSKAYIANVADQS